MTATKVLENKGQKREQADVLRRRPVLITQGSNKVWYPWFSGVTTNATLPRCFARLVAISRAIPLSAIQYSHQSAVLAKESTRYDEGRAVHRTVPGCNVRKRSNVGAPGGNAGTVPDSARDSIHQCRITNDLHEIR